MLSDEEKKAIEKIERLVKYFEDWDAEVTVEPEDKKYFDTILNLIENLIFKTETQKELLAYKTDKIEKQSKEIEELKENKKKLEDELNKYIVKMSDEQYRRLVDIIRDEINKLWEDKIKAKIEELKQKQYILSSKDSEIEILQSLLEKE